MLTSLLVITILCLPTIFTQPVNLTQRPFWDGEPTMQVNPLNPNQLTIAYMSVDPITNVSIKILISSDAGASWSTPILIPHALPGFTSADPALLYDMNGILHLVYIDYAPDKTQGAIYYRRSPDQGQSWSPPVPIITITDDTSEKPIDRPWIATHDGKTIFVTSMSLAQSSPPPNRPFLSVSYDSGATWTWTYLDSGAYAAGTLIRAPMPTPIANQDTLLAVYPSYLPSENPFPRFVLVKWHNGNRTYRDILFLTSATANDSLKRAYLLLKNPVNPNHLVFLFLGTQYGDPDIFMMESFNNGIQWTNPIRINDDPIGNQIYQDMLWGAFSQQGDLAICWRDRRNSKPFANANYDFYCTIRTDSSQTFSPNLRISPRSFPFDTAILRSGNDFMSCALTDSFLFVVWGAYDTSTSSSGMNIWFARLHRPTETIQAFPIHTQQKTFSITRVNHHTLLIQSTKPIHYIAIYDQSGRLLYTLQPNTHQTYIHLNHRTKPISNPLILYIQDASSSPHIIKWLF